MAEVRALVEKQFSGQGVNVKVEASEASLALLTGPIWTGWVQLTQLLRSGDGSTPVFMETQIWEEEGPAVA